jgi:hypothetical protein
VTSAVQTADPAVGVLHVGIDAAAPPKGTRDPELLKFAEDNGLALVTFDKDTMPTHVADHLAAGRRTRGVFIFPNGNNLSPGRIAEELILVWATSEAEEWIDRIEFLPY